MKSQKVKWVKAATGIRYREHLERLHNKKPDRYYVLRYTANGSKRQEALGWASEGVTLEKARLVLAKLKEANRIGEGPSTLAEQRELSKQKRLEKEASIQDNLKNAVTFKTYWKQSYWPAQSHKARGSLDAERALWSKWVCPFIGDIVVRDLLPYHLESVKNKMLKASMAPKSIKYAMALVSQIWSMAQRDGIVVDSSPTKQVSLPRQDNKRQRFLSKSEAEELLIRLLQESEVVYQMSLLALDCGLRFGEIAKLTWLDCDFEQEHIFIRDPKAYRNRFAFMTPRVKSMFKASSSEKNTSELIFQTARGTMYDRVPKVFRRIANELFNEGVEDKRQRVCFHSLRHTFASWLVAGGTNLYTVKELLGHADIVMTQRYSHLSPEGLKAAIKILS